MRAAFHESQGGLEVLRVGELPDPEPGADEVLIQVKATSMDRVDVYWREGSHGMKLRWPQHVGGRDIAGVVESVGSQVAAVAVGDRVVASGERVDHRLHGTVKPRRRPGIGGPDEGAGASAGRRWGHFRN